MYHSISDTNESGVSSYYKVCTSPGRFAEQMRWLEEAGYRGVTVSEGLALIQSKRPLPFKPIVITFDDGFADFYTAAYPVLSRHGFSATMYLPTAYIANMRRTFKERPCMTWSEVRELDEKGIEFGSHTVNHPILYRLAWPEIKKEVEQSKARIEEALGASVQSFAYPYSFPQADSIFTNRFIRLVAEAGYSSNVTTAVGRARSRDNPFLLKRLPVNHDDDRALLIGKLDGAYDWFGLPQAIAKNVRHSLRLSRERITSVE
jgi:peptidoglycan/xylan/chitin deacetylase (PgdA/CDA1 family)